MDELGLNRYCCRRMILTHVDLIEKLLRYVLSKDRSLGRMNRHADLMDRYDPSEREKYRDQY